MFDVEDEEAAEAFARKVTAEGPLGASAIVDGRLVITTSRDLLRAAQAAADGRALADSTRLDVAGEEEGTRPTSVRDPRGHAVRVGARPVRHPGRAPHST